MEFGCTELIVMVGMFPGTGSGSGSGSDKAASTIAAGTKRTFGFFILGTGASAGRAPSAIDSDRLLFVKARRPQ